MPYLNEQEKADLGEAGLLKLHKVMQRPVDKSIAEEALQNYTSNHTEHWKQGLPFCSLIPDILGKNMRHSHN